MLFIWPGVMYWLYRRLPADRALIWSILGGYLILPPVISLDLPVVPDLGKNSIPALTAAALVLLVRKERLPVLPDGWVGRVLIALFVLSPFATVLTNGEPLPKGLHDELSPMKVYDSVAAVTNQAIEVLPFFLARRYLASAASIRTLLTILLVAGLAYTIPMLIEIRLSPQLNVWIYGYFQHDFLQTIRFGGYRPVVFLPHGLWVALFAVIAAVSGLALAKEGPASIRPKLVFATLWMFAVLVLAKSTGALIYAALLVVLVLGLPRRGQVIVAAVLAAVVITYPLLRGAHLVPLDPLMAMAERISPERAHSLQFRIDNEESLLARASEKPLLGWGGYGRSMLYDPISGERISVADGAWIIILGTYGWLGYIALFGLLVLPLLKLGREAMAPGAVLTGPVAALSLIVAVNLVDLLPNATLVPLSWLLAGAIMGHAELMATARRAAAAEARRRGPWPRQQRTVL